MSGHRFAPGREPGRCARCGCAEAEAVHGGGIPAAWRDRPMPTLDELALFLGGSGTSFTGDLLRLMGKADPGNRALLARAFPFEDQALRAWNSIEPAPTFGQLEEQLNAEDEEFFADLERRRAARQQT